MTAPPPKELPLLDRLLAILPSLLVLLLPFLWFFHRLPDRKDIPHLTWNWAWLALPLVLAFLGSARRHRRQAQGLTPPPPGRLTGGLQKLAMAILVPFLLIAGLNTVLKAIDFKRELPPIVFESREPNALQEQKRVLEHPVYLFTFNPGTIYNAVRINRLGYREREIDPDKPPGSRRVICFGDSITAQGRPNYSGLLHALLQENPPTDQPWEAFNMAVYGYSARQGLAVFRLQGKPLQPDYITVYFGPNDRNLHAMTDKQRMARALPPWQALLLRNAQELRIGQLILGAARDRATARLTTIGPEQKVLRVPPDDYRFVLQRFVTEARELGAEAILLTAPRRALNAGLITAGYAISIEAAEARHDAYNAIVRDVARELNAPLVDLAVMMQGPAFDAMFTADGVHFDGYATEHAAQPASQPGLTFIANAIHAKLQELHTGGGSTDK